MAKKKKFFKSAALMQANRSREDRLRDNLMQVVSGESRLLRCPEELFDVIVDGLDEIERLPDGKLQLELLAWMLRCDFVAFKAESDEEKESWDNLFYDAGTFFVEIAKQYEDKDYVLMQHGFAKDLEFKITSEKENEICMLLESNDVTMEYYPFKFALLARYTARDTKLEVEYVVTNLNNKPMPFSLGVHPGFRCPLEPGLTIEDYYLEFNQQEDFVRIPLKGGLGTNERVKLTEPDTEL